MRKAFWAMMVCYAASASGAMPASAQNLPYCIKGCDFGGNLGDCSFTSYQQCLGGRDAYCAANPYFNAKAELLPHRRNVPKKVLMGILALAALGRATRPGLLGLATASALNNRYCITGGEGLPEGLVELVIRKCPFCAWCFRPGGILI